MSSGPPERQILLVEGEDDESVVWHLYTCIKGQPSFEISNRFGFEKLRSSIGVELRATGMATLGILMDADDNPEGRWKSVLDALRVDHASFPLDANRPGLIVDGDIRMGVWMMPNNFSKGELEDFIVTLIPANDPIWPDAQRYVEQIKSENRRFKPSKELKAKIHAWLATREKPRKMGTAIKAGDLMTNSSSAFGFANWLEKLFADSVVLDRNV